MPSNITLNRTSVIVLRSIKWVAIYDMDNYIEMNKYENIVFTLRYKETLLTSLCALIKAVM